MRKCEFHELKSQLDPTHFKIMGNVLGVGKLEPSLKIGKNIIINNYSKVVEGMPCGFSVLLNWLCKYEDIRKLGNSHGGKGDIQGFVRGKK